MLTNSKTQNFEKKNLITSESKKHFSYLVDVDATDLFSVDVDHPAFFYLVDGRRPSTSILQLFSSRPVYN